MNEIDLIRELREQLKKPQSHRDDSAIFGLIDSIEEIIKTDALTGLGNDQKLRELIDMLEVRKENTALAVLDIKGLGDTNDNYGRIYGDQLIILAADYLKNSIRHEHHNISVRPRDLFRAGKKADEFWIVSRDMDKEREEHFLDRIVKKSSSASLDIPNDSGLISLPLVFSYGYSINDGSDSLYNTMKIAYEMLNDSKKRLRA